MDEFSLKIKWEQSDYVTMGETLMSRNAGSEKRKLQLAVKSTSPGKMVNYFKSPLSKFPYHQRRAKWQNKQMKILIENLPLDHVCCVDNYSENYTCQHQDQIQSLYFGQTQANIHVTVLHWHPVNETVDGDSRDSDRASLCHIS